MTAIFTFSEYLRQSFISDYHVPAERVFRVGAGINLDQIPEDGRAKDYSIPRILFVGVEFERKGGRELLQAFRRVRERVANAELHIVGPHAMGALPPGVIYHGHLSKSDPAQREKLDSLYRASSLFVLPSLYEPFGIAPLEAMLHEVPCIVTDEWAFRETVQPGVNGDRVVKGDAEDLADKMIRMLGNADRLAAMGRRGREMVLREYTWTAVASRIASALNTISKWNQPGHSASAATSSLSEGGATRARQLGI
ncbi:MAG TPA: glycosyltransferase family 4 protein [Terracidiphilus sp.]|nr:glycosyltransferase family 4 protein [Terracidiphilus sp.]